MQLKRGEFCIFRPYARINYHRPLPDHMLFNSLSFALFLPIVFIFYWFLTNRNLKAQNSLLLIASYFFYGSWDYRFLFLLIFSTVLDYFTGIKMHEASDQKKKRFWFWLSVCTNLGFLGIFKYYNFFVSSFADGLSRFGLEINPSLLDVILPVGISFYTFHGLSYVIDIYNNRIKPERNFIDYSVFVSYFPLLVAGPIERATHLLPQIKKARVFNYEQASRGLFLILWGLFKKIVVADNCAPLVDSIFSTAGLPASTLVLGAVLFAFQIYADFSGYSDIAIGASKLFGIDLLINFRFPYFSRNIGEFWRRWHISLSTWFRDYLYIPLGGSKAGKWKSIRNVFIIFLVSGFWHGANWTFIIWGGIHALLFLPSFLFNSNKKYQKEVANPSGLIDTIRTFGHILWTFSAVTFAWIFFRATSVKEAIVYIRGIFDKSLLSIPRLMGEQNTDFIISFIGIIVLLIVEWNYRKYEFVFFNFAEKSMRRRILTLAIIVLSIYFFAGRSASFIYFQF